MFLKNKMLLFVIPFCLLFNKDVYLQDRNGFYWVQKEFLETKEPLDTFSVEKKDGIYFYKVMKKFYTDDKFSFNEDESMIPFLANINRDLHLVVLAINTGKMIKN